MLKIFVEERAKRLYLRKHSLIASTRLPISRLNSGRPLLHTCCSHAKDTKVSDVESHFKL